MDNIKKRRKSIWQFIEKLNKKIGSMFKTVKNLKKDVHQLFQKGGENYANFRPDYPKELYQEILKYSGRKDFTTIPNGSTVVDLACGGGQATKDLIPYFDKIIGMDVSESQIKNAFQNEKIIYKVGKSEDTGLENESVDLITVAQALHWFEFDPFFKEVDRILKKGGVLACWGYPLNYFEEEAATNALIHFFEDIDKYWHPKRKILDHKYKDVKFIYPNTLKKMTFQNKKKMTIENYMNYIRTWSSVITYIEKNQNDEIILELEEK